MAYGSRHATMRTMPHQRGFTMVELMVILIVLGILAINALPMFADLRQSARQAVVNDLRERALTLAANTRVAFIAKGGDVSASGATVTLSGNAITMDYGYPRGDANGIGKVLGSYTPPGGSLTSSSPNHTWTWRANCAVTYTSPSVAGTAAVVASVATGC